MDISNMKNIVVLKNLPSNLIDEAIVVLKENKKTKKYQYVEKNIVNNKDNSDNRVKQNGQNHILKEAELIINNYISNMEIKSIRGKGDIKKLENKYKKSVRLNFLLSCIAVLSIIFSLM